MKVCRTVILLCLSLCLLVSGTAGAVDLDAKNKGLYISPLRQQRVVAAGKATNGNLTIGNQTDKPMTVTLSVKQFSVTDYDYDYVFSEPKHDWLKFATTEVQISPHENKKVDYTLTIPQKTTPGGYYLSLVASTRVPGPGLSATVEAASLLYIKVAGNLVRTGVLRNDALPFFVTGSTIPYKFDVEDTGNVYFTAYFYGQLEDVFGVSKQPETGTSHLLMPGAVRTIEGSIPTPMLPGVYKATYGYKVDFAQIVVTKSAYVLFIPPWSVAALICILLFVRWLQQKRHKPQRSTKQID